MYYYTVVSKQAFQHRIQLPQTRRKRAYTEALNSRSHSSPRNIRPLCLLFIPLSIKASKKSSTNKCEILKRPAAYTSIPIVNAKQIYLLSGLYSNGRDQFSEKFSLLVIKQGISVVDAQISFFIPNTFMPRDNTCV